ncbi:hypothetical protein LZ31DRAFT_3285 [Colletotrichum somersetense]|nr:hypothetical protein LZ31DRAFT_3285 [Colletotrichum somersetense]
MGSISSKLAFDYRSTPATMGSVFDIASQKSDFPRPMRLGISRLGPIGLEGCKDWISKGHPGGGIAGWWRSCIFDGYLALRTLQAMGSQRIMDPCGGTIRKSALLCSFSFFLLCLLGSGWGAVR